MSFDVIPKSGSHLTGKVTLTDTGSGVVVMLDLQGLTAGKHGAHVHENPDCSAADAKTAGSHYNPDNHPHGLPAAPAHHIGDLGNIEVGKDGKGKLELTIADANLKAGDPHSFLGRSIIIHEKLDDGGQPVGNAGGRIGCVELK
jgi:Cu-Zn family superoxide dismutase